MVALMSVKVSVLDDPAEDPTTALQSNFEFCKKRAQLLDYLAICQVVKEEFDKIQMDNIDTPSRKLKVRQDEFHDRRKAWVRLVWHTVFVWTSNAFVERNSMSDMFMMQNPMHVNIENCRKNSLRTLREDMHYLELQDGHASERDKERNAGKRSLIRARIAAIEAEMLVAQERCAHVGKFHRHLQPSVHVTKHSHWVSLINGAQDEKDDVNVLLFNVLKDVPEQRPLKHPDDFLRGFSVTQDVKEGDFLCISYNEESVRLRQEGYFINSGNSLSEQAYVIPEVLTALKSFLALHQKHMPDFVYDYLLLCSELATRPPKGHVPQVNLELDWRVREPRYRGFPAL